MHMVRGSNPGRRTPKPHLAGNKSGKEGRLGVRLAIPPVKNKTNATETSSHKLEALCSTRNAKGENKNNVERKRKINKVEVVRELILSITNKLFLCI